MSSVARRLAAVAIALATSLSLTTLAVAPSATAGPPRDGGTSTPQIVGGTPASTVDYPWQVRVESVTSQGLGLCGGAVIHSRIVLTAAHCVQGDFILQGITVYFGQDLLGSGGVAANAAGYLVNQSYNPGTFNYDFATIYLETPIPAQFTPIKIAGPRERSLWKPKRMARAVGFGNTSEGGQASPTLLQAPMPIQKDAKCGKPTVYGTAFFKESMLCAGTMKGGVSTCQGDSGGPLVVFGDKGVARIAGIVSWGEGCARPNRPTVFTRIAEPGMTSLLLDDIAFVKSQVPQLFPGLESSIDIVGSGAVPKGCTAAKKAAKKAKTAVAQRAKAVKAAKTKPAKAKAMKALQAAKTKSRKAQSKAKASC